MHLDITHSVFLQRPYASGYMLEGGVLKKKREDPKEEESKNSEKEEVENGVVTVSK